MNLFERYLTIWVMLSIAIGIFLGSYIPDTFVSLSQMQYANINLPIAFLIWIMIIPMLIKVDFGAIKQIKEHYKGMLVTLFVNWLVKPFSMALLAWIFIQNLFVSYLPSNQINDYVGGLILLAAAPCTAMVFVWSKLTKGDPLFTLSQVALNDLIMIFAFAPIVALLLGFSSIPIPWNTLIVSLIFYILIPVVISQVLRKYLLEKGKAAFNRFMDVIGKFSMLSLLTTLVLLFAFQGKEILEQPLVIFLIAIPITIQVFFNSALAYWLNHKLGEAHNIACPSALIGASNFFELAVATAISLFGIHSGAALATVVGVLVEVPLMLLVVRYVNQSKTWYQNK